VSALGASISKPVHVSGSELVLLPSVTVGESGVEMLKEITVGSCSPVDGRYMTAQTGAVTLTASRGGLYRDAACSQPLTGARASASGSVPRTYIRSDNAGVSTVDAVVTGGPAASTRLEFVAPLAATSKVNLQTDVAVVGSGERGTGEQVRGTRSDRRADREGLPAPGVPGVADGLVRLGLFVPALVVRHDRRIKLLVLLEGLPDAGNVAVAEDPESARNQPLAVVLAADRVDGVLLGQVFDDGLGDRHSACS
jgi:hypothetical protein